MDIPAILTAFLAKQGDSAYDSERLHYGSDLDPDACARKIAFRLAGTPRDALTVGDEIRFHGGREWESLVADALEAAGHKIERQVLCKPLRPSAWAFAPGHADILLVEEKRLLEIKAPRAGHFARAGQDPKRLVRAGHRWQLSSYYHELKRTGSATSAAWVFLDREGSNAPQVVELDESFLVPLPDIIEQENAASEILLALMAGGKPEAEDRPESTIRVDVLRGRGKTPVRTTRATVTRYWGCSYCPYLKTCAPGPEEAPEELTAEAHAACVAEAERRWAAGEKRVELELDAHENPMWVTGDAFPVRIAPEGFAQKAFDAMAAGIKSFNEQRAIANANPIGPNPCALCGVDLSTNPGHGHGAQELAEAFPPNTVMHAQSFGLGLGRDDQPFPVVMEDPAVEKAENPKDSAGFNAAALQWPCVCGRSFATSRGLNKHRSACAPATTEAVVKLSETIQGLPIVEHLAAERAADKADEETLNVKPAEPVRVEEPMEW